jgi:N-formylglutamate amidohydrolase
VRVFKTGQRGQAIFGLPERRCGWPGGTRGGFLEGPEPLNKAQWVLEPNSPPVPIVACLPHGGHYYPAELAGCLAVEPAVLWSDWLTRELYDFLPSLGITTITTAYSRFVADVNRDPAGEQHGRFWSSVVSAQMPDGQPVYDRPLI